MTATLATSAESAAQSGLDQTDRLRALVSSMLSGACDEQSYLLQVAAVCRAKPECATQLMGLIDRYQRLGQMPTAQHQKIQQRIEQALIGSAAPAFAPAAAAADLTVTARLPAATDQAASPPDSRSEPEPGSHLDAPLESPQPRAARAQPDAAALLAYLTLNEEHAAGMAPQVIAPGTLLRDRYEIQGLLGYGGMACVYQALDRYRARLGLPDCCVALKLVPQRSTHTADTEALASEFHNAQQLSHPNIVKVYELDHDGDASFYTMELLEGERLDQLLQRLGGALPARYALAIIRDIGAAIAHAHSRAVVHADLKPHNVFLTRSGQVQVLDFGSPNLSPPIGAGPDAYRTATPAYASCEQLEGQRADARDDIYALACIAYELLSGVRPFDGKSSLAARAERLQPRRPTQLRASSWVALRAGLAWQREQRPQEISPWLEQLGVSTAVEHLPVLHQLAPVEPPRLWMGRLAVAAALVLMLVSTAIALQLQGNFPWQGTLAKLEASLTAAVSGTAAPASDTRGSASVARSAAVSAAPDASGVTAESDSAAQSQPAAHSGTATQDVTAAQASTARASDARASAAPPDRPASAAPDNMGVAFAATRYAVADGAPAARLVVRRTGSFRGDIRFVWWTQEDSAKEEVDYAPLGRRVEHIPPGENTVTIYVPIISNPLRHQTETFFVALGAPGIDNPTATSERAAVTIERGG